MPKKCVQISWIIALNLRFGHTQTKAQEQKSQQH